MSNCGKTKFQILDYFFNHAVFYVNCTEISKCSGLNCHMIRRDVEVYAALQAVMYCGMKLNGISNHKFLSQGVLYIQQGQQ